MVADSQADSQALPAGWHVVELAEQRARQALASWDNREHSRALYLHRAMALAEAVRKLLAELDAERVRRTGER